MKRAITMSTMPGEAMLLKKTYHILDRRHDFNWKLLQETLTFVLFDLGFASVNSPHGHFCKISLLINCEIYMYQRKWVTHLYADDCCYFFLSMVRENSRLMNVSVTLSQLGLMSNIIMCHTTLELHHSKTL